MLLALLLMIFSKSNPDTIFANIHQHGKIKVSGVKTRDQEIDKKLNVALKSIQNIYNGMLSKSGCSADNDTLDLDIIIDNELKKIITRRANEFDEEGVIDSLLFYGKKISEHLKAQEILKIRYITTCEISEDEKVNIIRNGLRNMRHSDSVNVYFPDAKCIHVDIYSKSRTDLVLECEKRTRILNVPIIASYTIDASRIDSQNIERIVNAIGVRRKYYAACYELLGMLLVHGKEGAKAYKFDLCNGSVDYFDGRNTYSTFDESHAFDKIVTEFDIEDKSYNELKNSFGISR